jgi:hypothetical protein
MMNMRDFNLKKIENCTSFVDFIYWNYHFWSFKFSIVIIVLREPPLKIGNSKTSENQRPWKPPSFLFLEFLKTSYSKMKIWKLKKSWGDSLDHLKEQELTVLTKKVRTAQHWSLNLLPYWKQTTQFSMKGRVNCKCTAPLLLVFKSTLTSTRSLSTSLILE